LLPSRRYKTRRAHAHCALTSTRGAAARLCLYAAAVYAVGLANSLADWRAQRSRLDAAPPLPDVLFELVPAWPRARPVPDAALHLAWLVLALGLQSHGRARLVVRALLDAQASLFALRALLVPLTTLPAPLRGCHRELPTNWLALALDPLRALASPDGSLSWCHDLIFSGHTSHLVLAALFAAACVHSRLARVLVYVLAAVGTLALLLARIHYSIDLATGALAAATVFARARPALHEAEREAERETRKRTAISADGRLWSV